MDISGRYLSTANAASYAYEDGLHLGRQHEKLIGGSH